MLKFPVILLCGALLTGALPFVSHAETASSTDKTFSQSVKEGYQDLKNTVTETFGGYTGNTQKDNQAYMDNYKNDLKDYHKAVQDARDDYRKARLGEQKSYLEHHKALPMQENIDSDMTRTAW